MYKKLKLLNESAELKENIKEHNLSKDLYGEIGRASCRERV